MSTKSTASNLKAHLGRYMKAVKCGQEVTITDLDEPVAKLVPFTASSSMSIRPPLSSANLATAKLRGIKHIGLPAQQLLDDTRGGR